MKSSLILITCLGLACCQPACSLTVAPKPVDPADIAFDAQTGKQDGGLIDSFTGPDGTTWSHMSDDFRADYIRLLGQFGYALSSPPKDANEGWNLTAPISCNGGVRATMKKLRVLEHSAAKLAAPLPAPANN